MTPTILRQWIALIAFAVALLAASPAFGERYALLVGVKKYRFAGELSTLQYTENDVTELASVLLGSGYKRENVVLMTQARGGGEFQYMPFKQQIRDELELLLESLQPEDSLIVALSGHGVQCKGDDDAYFCPADARLSRPDSLLSLSGIYKDLEKCKASHKLLLVDACRNDPNVGARSGAKSVNPNADKPVGVKSGEVDLGAIGAQPAVEPPGGVLAFYSCMKGEKAFEHEELKGGVFLHYLAEGLGGEADLNEDREVMLGELLEYTIPKVQSFVRDKLGRQQHPELHGVQSGLFSITKVGRPLEIARPRSSAAPLPTRPRPVNEVEENDRQLSLARQSLLFYRDKVKRLDADIEAKTKQKADLKKTNEAIDAQIAEHRLAITRGYYKKGTKVIEVFSYEIAGIRDEIEVLKAKKRTADAVDSELIQLEGFRRAMQSSLDATGLRVQTLERQKADLAAKVGVTP